MVARFTLEYWKDGVWYVGRLREVPGVFSQGETLKELEENIRDAYRLVLKEQPAIHRRARHGPIVMPAPMAGIQGLSKHARRWRRLLI